MSCSTTANSIFLRRIVPIHRLGLPAVALKSKSQKQQQQEDDSFIEYGTDEWRNAMCLLYRNLLVLHKLHVPDEQRRDFGNRFLQAEFRRGKQLEERYAIRFYQEWMNYGVQVERGAARKGRDMSEEQERKLTEEQRSNLDTFRRHTAQMHIEDTGREAPGLGAGKFE